MTFSNNKIDAWCLWAPSWYSLGDMFECEAAWSSRFDALGLGLILMSPWANWVAFGLHLAAFGSLGRQK